ncbi:hypothetical protein HD597_001745 [Nonomuraea thailandensis]|uniref:Uncharacterized protein n=1 Tax=Nonomuraea thailandensis TaxID=1188745 RepID=A0A9X2GBQ2_9ACTN|nr:hypothetical protein [Nonomuraea thailandensis]
MAWDGLRPDVRGAPAGDPHAELERWSRSTGTALEVWAPPGEPLPEGVAGLVRATIFDVLDHLGQDGSVRCVGIALTALTAGARGLRLTVSGDGSGLAPRRLADRLRVRRPSSVEGAIRSLPEMLAVCSGPPVPHPVCPEDASSGQTEIRRVSGQRSLNARSVVCLTRLPAASHASALRLTAPLVARYCGYLAVAV